MIEVYLGRQHIKMTENCIFANISNINKCFHKLWFLEPALTVLRVSQ